MKYQENILFDPKFTISIVFRILYSTIWVSVKHKILDVEEYFMFYEYNHAICIINILGLLQYVGET